MNKELLTEIEEIAEDTYYESIFGYTAEGTDTDDSNEMKKAIKEAIIQAISLYIAKYE